MISSMKRNMIGMEAIYLLPMLTRKSGQGRSIALVTNVDMRRQKATQDPKAKSPHCLVGELEENEHQYHQKIGSYVVRAPLIRWHPKTTLIQRGLCRIRGLKYFNRVTTHLRIAWKGKSNGMSRHFYMYGTYSTRRKLRARGNGTTSTCILDKWPAIQSFLIHLLSLNFNGTQWKSGPLLVCGPTSNRAAWI